MQEEESFSQLHLKFTDPIQYDYEVIRPIVLFSQSVNSRSQETVAPPPLLDGGDLMAAPNLEPGPEIGRLLRLIEEAQATGEVNSKAEALALARREMGD
jgi:hypothetical protein